MPYAKDGRKVCSACREEFPLSGFNRNRRAKDGLNNQCKTCLEVSRRKYRQSLSVCSMPGCTNVAVGGVASGPLCSSHYRRRLAGQDMDVPIRSIRPRGAGTTNAQGYRVRMIAGRNVKEHRWIMEQVLGRPLWPDENVHHKNGKRDDNRPENLELWCKPQLPGQRVDDLLDFMVSHYAKELRQRLKLAPK